MKFLSYVFIFSLGLMLGYTINKAILNPYQLTIQQPIKTITPITSAIQPITTPTLSANLKLNTTSTLNDIKDEYDPVYLMQQAITLANKEKYLPAIKLLTDLFFQVNTPYKKQDIEQKIIQLTTQYLSKYYQKRYINNRIDLMESILNFLPDATEIRLKLIHGYITKMRFYQVESHLNYLNNNPNWQIEISEARQRFINTQRFANGEVKIPIIHSRNGWIVQANIANKTVRLLLDTGANLTIIKENFITENQYLNNQKTFIINTANGTTSYKKHSIAQFQIGDIIDYNFDVGLLDAKQLSHQHIDGLLGTDWLGRFSFKIDQQNKVLIINKKLNRKVNP